MKPFSFRTVLALLPTVLLICLPLLTLAQRTGPGNVPTGVQTGPGNVPTGYKLENPLSINNFCDLVKTILDAVLVIGMPIAVLFLVYVGFGFILARGNPEKLSVARKNFLHTVIGIAIFLGAWTIAKLIQATLVNLGATAAKQC